LKSKLTNKLSLRAEFLIGTFSFFPVLTYVLLSGVVPFGTDSKQETYLNISRATYTFPRKHFNHVSSSAFDFIRRLLCIKPRYASTSTPPPFPAHFDSFPKSQQFLFPVIVSLPKNPSVIISWVETGLGRPPQNQTIMEIEGAVRKSSMTWRMMTSTWIQRETHLHLHHPPLPYSSQTKIPQKPTKPN